MSAKTHLFFFTLEIIFEISYNEVNKLKKEAKGMENQQFLGGGGAKKINT